MTEPVELPDEAQPSVGISMDLWEDGQVAVTIVCRPLDLGVVLNPAYAATLMARAIPPEAE